LTNILLDLGDEGFHTPQHSAANRSSGDNVKPDFHLIQLIYETGH